VVFFSHEVRRVDTFLMHLGLHGRCIEILHICEILGIYKAALINIEIYV